MSFYRDDYRTSRKERKCDLCSATIKIGEKYHSKAGKYDGDIWCSNECVKCQSVVNEFLEIGSEDGYSEDCIRDWWVDYKCPECVNYWIDCTAGEHCTKMTHLCRCENYKAEEE